MSENFFRFPLRVLSVFETPIERLEKIVSYCVMDVGYKHLENSNIDAATLEAKRQLAWEHGCKIVNVRSLGADADIRLQSEFDIINQACGTDAQATVTIKNWFLWHCLGILRGKDVESPLSYREFSVLCAVLSKLGDKELVSCSWREIQRRALGYATKEEMARKLSSRADKAKPLSRQQIRATLTTLERNKFFARYSVGNGDRCVLTYFSMKMTKAQLPEAATADYFRRRRRKALPQGAEERKQAAALWHKYR